MISCPSCGSKLSFQARKQQIKKLSSPTHYAYQICWVAKVDIHCPACNSMISSSFLEKHLPEDLLISEGARAMSVRNKKRFTSKTGTLAANKKWNSGETAVDEEFHTGGKELP